MAHEPVHKDPGWWRRCKPSPYATSITDMCDLCGHVRDMHGPSGCTATSTSLIGNPGPCMCVNRRHVGNYRDAQTFDRSTLRG